MIPIQVYTEGNEVYYTEEKPIDEYKMDNCNTRTYSRIKIYGLEEIKCESISLLDSNLGVHIYLNNNICILIPYHKIRKVYYERG